MSQTKDILSIVEQDGVIIVRFTRSRIFDVETAEALDAEFRRVIPGKADGCWIIDFSGLELIISRVVNSLLIALRLIRDGKGQIYLCNMNETIDRVIRLARLDRVFKTFPTLETALAAAKSTPSS